MYAKLDKDNKVVALISASDSYLDETDEDSRNHFWYKPAKLTKMSDAELAAIGLVKVISEPMPEYNRGTHTCTQNILKVGDTFKTQTWNEPELLSLEERQEIVRNIRRFEYPSLGDQMDAAYKSRMGDNTEQIIIDELIQSVKDNNPIPTI